MGNDDYYNNGGIDKLNESGNTPIVLNSYTPAAPTGLSIVRFFNSYLLRWDDNLKKGETQTYEYIVYRDGQKLDISPRGGTFYVDIDVDGMHTYSVSAINLSKIEGPKSESVSTSNAKNGWWDDLDNTPPRSPINVRITD